MITFQKLKRVGLIGFGAYLPYWRLPVEAVAEAQGGDADQITAGLGLVQKAVAARDEDTVTMAVAAAQLAVVRAGIKPGNLGAVFVGSESHPYAVKPSGVIVAQALGLDEQYFCADLEFACKAGTAAMQITAALVEAGQVAYGLAIGADKSQARPGDALEYSAGAGAAAFVLGPAKGAPVRLVMIGSVAADTPDFWRRAGMAYPQHTGRFTGEPGYFAHLRASLKHFFAASGTAPADFEAVIFHMPNAKFPLRLAREVGVTDDQLKTGFLVPEIGNLYAACSPVGLVAALEKARPGQNILMASYGSGAGSDVMWWRTTTCHRPKHLQRPWVSDYLQSWEPVDYLTYLRFQEVL